MQKIMIMPPFTLTLVIPLYNKEERIKECILSAIDQIEPFYQIIIINDGSSDKSAEIAKEITKDHDHIRLISQENKGVSNARNHGWSLAETPFVSFLDADDILLPNFTKQARLIAEKCPKALLYGFGHTSFDPNIGEYIPSQGLPKTYFNYVDDYFKSASKGSIIRSSTVMIKTSVLNETNGFPEGVAAGEDLYLWSMIALIKTQHNVAYNGEFVARIYQLEDNSRINRVGKIPYILTYFSNNSEALNENKSLKAYIWRTAYLHILGAIQKGENLYARQIIDELKPVLGIKYYVLIAVEKLPIQNILTYIRSIRRRFKRYN